jgi:hypothetical protein
MVYSGTLGKLIREKNQKSKISWHCPFKQQSELAWDPLVSVYEKVIWFLMYLLNDLLLLFFIVLQPLRGPDQQL